MSWTLLYAGAERSFADWGLNHLSRKLVSQNRDTVRFDAEAMRRALDDDGLYATDLAEALVAAGVPFRDAHRRTGELLKRTAAEKRSLGDLNDDEWAAFGLANGRSFLDPDRSVRARAMRGGPSPDSVRDQIASIDRLLADRSRT